jgi:hypothetical protein
MSFIKMLDDGQFRIQIDHLPLFLLKLCCRQEQLVPKRDKMYLIRNCVTILWPQVGVLSIPNGGVLLVERFEYR